MFPLKTINFSNPDMMPAQFFRSADIASVHILDHLLSANECFFWFEKCPVLSEIAQSSACDNRFYAARELVKQPELFEPIYTAYHKSVQKTVLQAECCTGWIGETETARIYMGIDGIIAILDIQTNTFLTAYLGGAGDPLITAAHTKTSLNERKKIPLPREQHQNDETAEQSKRRRYGKSLIRKRKGAVPPTHRDSALNDCEYAHQCFIQASSFVRNQPKHLSLKKEDDVFCPNDLYALRRALPFRRTGNDEWTDLYNACMKRGLL
jgi:hypothetical protein